MHPSPSTTGFSFNSWKWSRLSLRVNGYYKLILWLDKRCNSLALIGQELLSCISCPIRVDVCNNRSPLRLTTELINLGILIYLLLFSFKLDKRGQLLFTFSAVLKRQWPVQTRHQIQCDFVMHLRPQWDQKKKTLVSTVNVVLNHKLSNNYKTWLKKLWRRFI